MAWLRTVSGAVLVAALAVSGCSGGSGAKVATLGGGGSSDSSSSSSASKQSFEDALVAYSKCMRDHGVDMPDPQFTSNGDGSKGGFAVVGPAAGGEGGNAPAFDPSSAEFKAADEACKPILDEATKDMPKPSPEELAEQRDKALAFAKCMREHGVDMPDPTFDDNGSISIAAPGADGGAGADPKSVTGPDQAFQDAAKACQQDGGPGFVITNADGGGGGTAVGGATTGGGN